VIEGDDVISPAERLDLMFELLGALGPADVCPICQVRRSANFRFSVSRSVNFCVTLGI